MKSARTIHLSASVTETTGQAFEEAAIIRSPLTNEPVDEWNDEITFTSLFSASKSE